MDLARRMSSANALQRSVPRFTMYLCRYCTTRLVSGVWTVTEAITSGVNVRHWVDDSGDAPFGSGIIPTYSPTYLGTEYTYSRYLVESCDDTFKRLLISAVSVFGITEYRDQS